VLQNNKVLSTFVNIHPVFESGFCPTAKIFSDRTIQGIRSAPHFHRIAIDLAPEQKIQIDIIYLWLNLVCVAGHSCCKVAAFLASLESKSSGCMTLP